MPGKRISQTPMLESYGRLPARACCRTGKGACTPLQDAIDLRVGAEKTTRHQAILIDLLHQRLDTGERPFGTLEGNELDQQSLAVNVASEIQNMDFDSRRAVIELRACAVAGNAVQDLAIQENAHGIDAKAELGIVIWREVGRRKTELPSALISVHNLTFDRPPPAEKMIGAFYVTNS